MRKIEKLMVQAIVNRERFAQDNTMVSIVENTAQVFLHGNHIATMDYTTRMLTVNVETLRRWPSPTTKSRLRALNVNVYTKNHTTYLNNEVI